MPWISGASIRLDALLQRGLSDGTPLVWTALVYNTYDILPGQRQAEASTLTSQLTRALSIIQGVALTHHSTKVFLGRRYPLDVGNVSCHVHSWCSSQRAGAAGSSCDLAPFGVTVAQPEAACCIRRGAPAQQTSSTSVCLTQCGVRYTALHSSGLFPLASSVRRL